MHTTSPRRSASELTSRLFAPVDAAGLVYFRVAFYTVMLWEAARFMEHGWIDYWSDKNFYFGYWPLEFVRPLSFEILTTLILVLAILAALVIVGMLYRVSAAAFFVLFAYFFLVEKARYLNHLYLVCLISFLMIFVPAARYWSVDALFRRRKGSPVVPAWSIWLLRFQVGVPMFFGGIAKLNHDWLRGEPLRSWLHERADFPLIGQFFYNEGLVWLMTYWAVFFDLFAPFFLLYRRTRVFAFLAALHFHFTNSRLFNIGIFPWAMIVSTIVFFPPDWPRRVIRDFRTGNVPRIALFSGGFALGFWIGGFLPEAFVFMRGVIGGLGVAVAAYHIDEPFRHQPRENLTVSGEAVGSSVASVAGRLTASQRWALVALAVWVSIQVLVPLRHFVIPGQVHWTEEGHNFSWHMKLRDKDASGSFMVRDPVTGEEWGLDASDYLTRRQAGKMFTRPHMIVQFARWIEEQARLDGYGDIEVYAYVEASLNGRIPQPFIDPSVDLTAVAYPWFGHASWIVPLDTPLWARNE